MRRSIKLLTVIAAAGFLGIGAASALTTSNTTTAIDDINVAGYSEVAATGATITGVEYTPVPTEPAELSQVVFDTTTTFGTGVAATLTLRSTATVGTVLGTIIGTYDCVVVSGATITCPTTVVSTGGVGIITPLVSTVVATDLTVG